MALLLLLVSCSTMPLIAENTGGRQGMEVIGASGSWVLHAKTVRSRMVEFWRVTDIAGRGMLMTWKFPVGEEAWRELRAGQVLTDDEVTRLRAALDSLGGASKEK